MRGKLITLVCVILSFMTCLLGIGYAAISGELHITGDAVFGSFPIYITEVERYSASAATNALNKTIYSITFMNSKITLDGCQDGESSSDVVLAITVENASTDNDYVYNGVTGAESIADLTVGIYADPACTVGLDCFNGVVPKRNEVGEKQTLTFYVKLSHAQEDKKEYNPIFTFNFTDNKVAASNKLVVQKTLDVLNSTTDTYEDLLNAMQLKVTNNKGGPSWGNTYIGNVPGAYDYDKEVLNTLLGSLKRYGKNGSDVELYYVIAKEQPSISANTDEISIFMANADDFKGTGDTLPVDVIVFSNRNGKWEQVGITYSGYANYSKYYMATDNSKGSYDTSSWKSSQSYHGLASGKALSTIIGRYVADNY